METQIVMTTDLPTSSTDTSVFDFQAWTDAQLQRTEQALSAWVGVDAPANLGDAMRYAVPHHRYGGRYHDGHHLPQHDAP